jgi:hypothetical protein
MARLKVLRLVVGVLLLLAATSVATAQSWTAAPNSTFHFWRFDGEYFPGTGMVYFLGGRLTDLSTSGAVWSFDPVAGTYAATGATMSSPVSNYDVCLLEDDYNLPGGDTWGLYIFAGRLASNVNTNAVQVYYPRSNTVRTVTSDPFPGLISGNTYSAQASVVYDNKAYVFGGFYATSYLTTPQTWVFDPLAPSGTMWTQLSDLPWSRGYIAGAVVDSMVYAIGGDTAVFGSPGALYATVDCAVLNGNDPGSSWVPIASLPQITDETRAFGFNHDSPYDFPGQIVTAGQGQWQYETPVCYRYDADANTWNTFPNLILGRRNHAGAFIPGDQNSGGIPGMWIWGGRAGADTAIFTTEYYPMTSLGVAENGATHLVRHLEVAPSPLTGTGRVSYELTKPGNVRLVLFDITGRSVATLVNGRVEAGPHSTLLDAHQLRAGVYLLRLDASSYRETRKVVLQ